MKLIRFSTVCCALLVLASCARPATLPPEEVLQRAARASREMPSARFTARLVLDGPDASPLPMHAELDAQGRMQHGGRQMAFSLEGSGNSGPDTAWQGKAEVVIAGENDVYVLLREFTAPSSDETLSLLIGQFLNQWWHLPPGETPPAAPGMTPDPQMLRMQADIVDVVRDRGLATVHGRSTYHYDVKLNPEKLQRFLEEVAKERGEPADAAEQKALTEGIDGTGELRIDADTFAVQGLRWTISSGDQSRPMTVHAEFDITDFESGEAIGPPKDARVLPLSPSDFLPSGVLPSLP